MLPGSNLKQVSDLTNCFIYIVLQSGNCSQSLSPQIQGWNQAGMV